MLIISPYWGGFLNALHSIANVHNGWAESGNRSYLVNNLPNYQPTVYSKRSQFDYRREVYSSALLLIHVDVNNRGMQISSPRKGFIFFLSQMIYCKGKKISYNSFNDPILSLIIIIIKYRRCLIKKKKNIGTIAIMRYAKWKCIA